MQRRHCRRHVEHGIAVADVRVTDSDQRFANSDVGIAIANLGFTNPNGHHARRERRSDFDAEEDR